MKSKSTHSDAVSQFALAYLLKKGITASEVAEILGVTKSYVSRVKSGQRSFTIKHLTTLASETDEPLAFLFMKSMPIASVPSSMRPLYRSALKLMDPDQQVRKRKSKAA